MKFLIKSINIPARVHNASKEFGFEMKNDLAGTQERSTPMYSIFDDAAMTVSHYNTISEEKTASYKFFDVKDVNGAYLVIAMIAGILSFDIEQSLTNETFKISSVAAGTDFRSSLLSKFTIGNRMGRTIVISYYPVHLDMKLPAAQSIKEGNLMDLNIIFNSSISRGNLKPHSLATGNMYAIKNMQEMLGCTIDEFIDGLKDLNALNPLKKLISNVCSISDLATNPAILVYDEIGHIEGTPANTNGLSYVILKGSKETLAIRKNIFLNAIDLSEPLYTNMRKQMGSVVDKTFRILPNAPAMSFKESASGGISIIATNPINALEFVSYRYDLIKKEYVT